MDFNHTPQKETTTSALQTDQIFPSYHRILEKEYYMRKKLLTNVLNTLTLNKIEKFIQEVFWRVYWKGWLEGRSKVWREYKKNLKSLLAEYSLGEKKNIIIIWR